MARGAVLGLLALVCVLSSDGHLLSVQNDRVLRNRIVSTTIGTVRGTYVVDGNYHQFLGVPYGAVSVNNPFGESYQHPVLSEIFEADVTTVCPQIDPSTNEPIGDLDCLRLNVYSPATVTGSSQLPVLIFLHGGGFTSGSGLPSNLGPRHLIGSDVIIVTVNYRLGAYGFMCLDVPQVPGNRGLRDQSMAFRWVRDNIANFGGDPNSLTLVGHEAGGDSIDLHLHSIEERIFHRAILQSGTALTSSHLADPDREAPLKIAANLGFETTDVQEALNYLAYTPTNDVITAAAATDVNFLPCVEHRFVNVPSFIVSSWVNADVPKIRGMPVLIGTTEFESLEEHIDKDQSHYDEVSELFTTYLNETFDFDAERLERMSAFARQYYLGDDVLDRTSALPFVNFVTDFVYAAPAQRTIEKYLDSGARDVFYYIFGYTGNRNIASINNLSVQGASHGDDLRYLFDLPQTPLTLTQQDATALARMITLWTNFARTGNPVENINTLTPVTWTPATRDNLHVLLINSTLTMDRRPYHRRMAFWELFYTFNRDLVRTFEPQNSVDLDLDLGNGSFTASASVFAIILSLALTLFRL